jgi:hypothetical protein
LPNGTVVIAGGYNTAGPLPSAELYDPRSGNFTAAGDLGTARYRHTATLLPAETVLIAGGADFTNTLSSAELYDVGTGFADSRRPRITAAPASLVLPATLTLTGSGFRGDSEASSGGTNSAATNYPVVQLQRLDNEQTVVVPSRAAFTDTGWSATLYPLAVGWYRATVITNGIPSLSRFLTITNRPSGFTDSVLTPRVSPIRAVHITELRQRIDALRVTSGLGAYAWTPPTLTSGVTVVAAPQILDLRLALHAVYVAKGRTPPAYSNASLVLRTTPILVVHVAELRAAVLALE